MATSKATKAPQAKTNASATPLILFTLFVVSILSALFGVPAPIQNVRLTVASWFDNTPVHEIYGLYYFVTRPESGSLKGVDPTKPIDWVVYAGGDGSVNWKAFESKTKAESPLFVFSKTYCPHCKSAKNLLDGYNLSPAPKIVEVDLREDGDVIKTILGRLTGRSTFPNIVLHGKSIGGNDNIQAAAKSRTLKKTLKEGGLIPRKK